MKEELAAESEVGQLSAIMGTLWEEKFFPEAKVTRVEMEMDLLQVELQEAKQAGRPQRVSSKRCWLPIGHSRVHWRKSRCKLMPWQ